MDAITDVPPPVNEPIHDYAPNSAERARLHTALTDLTDHPIELPHVIGGTHRMGDGERIAVVQPHRHNRVRTLRQPGVLAAKWQSDCAGRLPGSLPDHPA